MLAAVALARPSTEFMWLARLQLHIEACYEHIVFTTELIRPKSWIEANRIEAGKLLKIWDIGFCQACEAIHRSPLTCKNFLTVAKSTPSAYCNDMSEEKIVLRLFTKQPLVECWKCERLYEILDHWRFRPSKFNDVEPVRNAWGDRSKFREQFEMNCRESFGVLIVEWKKPKFDSMVIWSRGPLAKHHCLSFFTARYQDLGGSKVPYLLELADQLFEELDFHYGFACMDAEYHATNINLDVQIDERTVQPKQVVGMEWPDCLPGLYWLQLLLAMST